LFINDQRRYRVARRQNKRHLMKVVVIGGTGLIGSNLVTKLREHGHEALAAAPSSGVNSVTGEGLDQALKGANVVVDVSNSPSFEEQAATDFFVTSTRNLLAAESRAGVRHHVALSVVGTERLLESGYFRAKMAQERLIQASSVPHSIVHATQFFEFAKSIADFSTQNGVVRLPPVSIQPIAALDVAGAVGSVAVGVALNGTVEVGGPAEMAIATFVGQILEAGRDPRKVLVDAQALYFGIRVTERTLLPAPEARRGATTYAQWLSRSAA
jgi:uncharacterized protein YbjT (DUF2867 family)